MIKGTFNEEFMFFDDYALQSRKEVIDHLIQGVPLEKTFGKKLETYWWVVKRLVFGVLSEMLKVFLRKTCIFN